MIKIIASDLDGTLLQNGSQTISSRMIDIITKLQEKNIMFVAASGRQYANLYRLFEPVNKNMAFICENGGVVMYQNKLVGKSSMDKEKSLLLIDDIYNQDGCEVLVSGENTSYLKPKTERYYNRMANVLKNNVKLVDDYASVDEEFVKVSVYQESGITTGVGPYLQSKWKDIFKETISGHAWLDFTSSITNKGNALQSLLDKFSITTDEAMVFGDNYNDLEMLSLVKYGYVMNNAVPPIKEMYTYHSNLVEDTLEELIKEGII